MDVLRRSARKSRIGRIKNEHIKEIMGVKEKPDIIDIIERKRLQWYGHVKRMQDERLPKLIMERIPGERRRWKWSQPLTNRPRLRTLPPPHSYGNQRLQRQFDGLLMMGIVMPLKHVEQCLYDKAIKFYD